MLINRHQKKLKQSPYQTGVGPVVRKRVAKANIQSEAKIVQGVVAVILQPMAGAAALPPPAPAVPLPHPRLPLSPLVVHHDLPPLVEKGDVAGPLHTSPIGVVVATAPTGGAVTVMTKVETEEGV